MEKEERTRKKKKQEDRGYAEEYEKTMEFQNRDTENTISEFEKMREVDDDTLLQWEEADQNKIKERKKKIEQLLQEEENKVYNEIESQLLEYLKELDPRNIVSYEESDIATGVTPSAEELDPRNIVSYEESDIATGVPPSAEELVAIEELQNAIGDYNDSVETLAVDDQRDISYETIEAIKEKEEDMREKFLRLQELKKQRIKEKGLKTPVYTREKTYDEKLKERGMFKSGQKHYAINTITGEALPAGQYQDEDVSGGTWRIFVAEQERLREEKERLEKEEENNLTVSQLKTKKNRLQNEVKSLENFVPSGDIGEKVEVEYRENVTNELSKVRNIPQVLLDPRLQTILNNYGKNIRSKILQLRDENKIPANIPITTELSKRVQYAIDRYREGKQEYAESEIIKQITDNLVTSEDRTKRQLKSRRQSGRNKKEVNYKETYIPTARRRKPPKSQKQMSESDQQELQTLKSEIEQLEEKRNAASSKIATKEGLSLQKSLATKLTSQERNDYLLAQNQLLITTQKGGLSAETSLKVQNLRSEGYNIIKEIENTKPSDPKMKTLRNDLKNFNKQASAFSVGYRGVPGESNIRAPGTVSIGNSGARSVPTLHLSRAN
jgi:hypothetical protein